MRISSIAYITAILGVFALAAMGPQTAVAQGCKHPCGQYCCP